MRGKDYNTGLRGVLFEFRHYERMGAAIWLYGWLVLRQTHQQGSRGWVLGGSSVSYREIEEETGFNARTLERWMQVLRRAGYVETEATPGGVIISITKAKKFPQGARNSAGTPLKDAGACPQDRGGSPSYLSTNQRAATGIGSSFVGGSQEGNKPSAAHRDFHRSAHSCGNHPSQESSSPSLLSQTENQLPGGGRGLQHGCRTASGQLDARLLRQLLRAEREEAVRRELAVGTGPEVERS